MSNAVIQESIEALFAEYLANPLRYLREIGLQVRLKELIQARLNSVCPVQISTEGKNRISYSADDRTEQTQIELRIQSENAKGGEKTDIVILRRANTTADRPITLTRYPMGHLDIVSKIHIDDVDAAIELKAACSSDNGQRHLFRKDIDKLLTLTNQTKGRLAAHFVLIDKSLAIGIHNLCEKPPRDNWHFEEPAEFEKWTFKEQEKCWRSSPKPTLLCEKPREEPYVHVWFLARSEESGNLEVRHRFVVSVTENSGS